MLKAAIYCRVSTNRQTTDNQIPDLERYVSQKGGEITRVYTENESAWRRGHQHELEACKLAASRREFDAVFVWALDRLSREGIKATIAIIDYFESYGIRVFSDQERFLERVDSDRDLWVSIKAWLAKESSDRNRERINAGLNRARAEGKRLGRPPGRKDGPGVKRNRVNYILKEERKRVANNLAKKIERRGTVKSGRK